MVKFCIVKWIAVQKAGSLDPHVEGFESLKGSDQGVEGLKGNKGRPFRRGLSEGEARGSVEGERLGRETRRTT